MTWLQRSGVALALALLASFPAALPRIAAANTPPVAGDKNVTTPEGTAIIVILSASDVEDCELTLSIVTGPSSGDLSPLTDQACTPGSPNADSAFVLYTPNTGFFGTDSFTYKATDSGLLDSNVATVTVAVALGVGTIQRPVMVGGLRGPASKIAVVDDIGSARAFMSGGSRLIAELDISNPIAPVILGNTLAPFHPFDIAISGDHMLLVGALNEDGPFEVTGSLAIADISSPGTPVFVGELQLATADSVMISVVAFDDFAFIATRAAGILVVSIADPMSPQLVAQVPIPDVTFSMFLSNGYLFASSASQTLVGCCQIVERTFLVVNVQEPTAPQIVWQTSDIGEIVTDILVHEHYAYLIGGEGKLFVTDLTDPTQPVVVTTLGTATCAPTLSFEGKILFIGSKDGGQFCSGFRGIRAVDISNPLDPSIVASTYTSGDLGGMVAFGGYLYAAAGDLLILDAKAHPSLVAQVDFLKYGANAAATSGGVVVDGNRVYLFGTGLDVVDISEPERPTIIGRLALPWVPKGGVDLSNGFAYVPRYSSYATSLFVVDLRDGTNPALICKLEVGEIRDVAVVDDYLFLGVSGGTLGYKFKVMDVSTPDDPTLVATLHLADFPYFGAGMWVRGEVAYTVINHSGSKLMTIDVTDPTNPSLAGSLTLDRWATDVAVEGPFAYVRTVDKLLIVDVSNPSDLELVGSIPLPGYGSSIGTKDSYVFAGSDLGLSIIDMASPETPLSITWLPMPGDVGYASVHNGYLLVASKGLLIYDVGFDVNVTCQLPQGEVTQGWTLIGWACNAPGDPSAIAAALGGTVRIYGYDPTTPANPWRLYDSTAPPFVNTLTALTKWNGYWFFHQPP